jgi:hypothetical protein
MSEASMTAKFLSAKTFKLKKTEPKNAKTNFIVPPYFEKINLR